MTWKIFLSITKAILALTIPIALLSSGFSANVPANALGLTSLTSARTGDNSNWVRAKPFWMQPTVTTTVDPHQFSYSKGSSLWVLVNKHRPLKPKTYKPDVVKPDFANKNQSNPLSYVLRADAAKALVAMDKAMMKAGAGRIILASGYRSYDSQTRIHTQQVNALGLVAGEKLAARPGYSEHQTGLAADLAALDTKGKSQGCYIQVCFADTKAGKWLAENSYKYGFILRYEKDQGYITGYQFEPWHFRFVGEDMSRQYEAAGQPTYERFLGAPNAPAYFKNKKAAKKEPKRSWLY